MAQTTLSAVVIIAAATLMSSAGAGAEAVASSENPNCSTSCGGMAVPFPFGMGPPARCHQLGLNLTCDRISNPPRLLLGDGTLWVVNISLRNTTSQEWVVALRGISTGGEEVAVPYALSRGGCAECSSKGHTGLIIGLSISSGTCLFLLFLGAILLLRKVKEQRQKVLKKKLFGQNRGQLLRQLVSHKTGMAERMTISLEELEQATDNFDETRKLGRGGHGTVYKGILSDLHVVAIKKSNIMVHKEINEFINEVAILSQIDHKNIVKLFGCCLESEVPLLAYEFISNGTLSDHLHKEPLRSIPWENRLRIATEIGKAIGYLHHDVLVPIIHRDIKSANIYLDDTLTTKVSGLGVSRHTHVDQRMEIRAVQGTRGYFDPTYYYTGRLTEKSDVYSFGVILVELLTRKIPTTYESSEGDGLVVQFAALCKEGNWVEIIDPQVVSEGGSEIEQVVSLAASCVKLRAEERPTMRQVAIALEGLQTMEHSR